MFTPFSALIKHTSDIDATIPQLTRADSIQLQFFSLFFMTNYSALDFAPAVTPSNPIDFIIMLFDDILFACVGHTSVWRFTPTSKIK